MAHTKNLKPADAHRRHIHPRLTAAAAAVLALTALPAAAQGTSSGGTLPAVQVQESAEGGDYKADKVSSPKFTQPLVDTPQTITVIKKEILQEQGARTLLEALRNTPGITMTLGEGGNSNTKDNIFMRGFDSSGSVYIDGVRDLGNFPRDMYNIEQVEIIKGPSGSEFGRGAPSGTINLATKVPRLENFVSGSGSLGTADQKRGTIDVNRILGETSAIRFNAMVQDSGVPGRDYVRNKGVSFAPSLALGLNTPTRTFLSYEHVEQDNRPDGGVTTLGLPNYTTIAGQARASRENYYGSLSDFEKVDGDVLTARIEHDLAAGTTLRNTTRVARVRHDLMLFAPGAATAGNPITVSRSRQTKWQENELFTNQTNLTTTFKTGAYEHTLSTGVELIQERQHNRAYSTVAGIPAANAYSPDPSQLTTAYTTLGFSGVQDRDRVTTLGLYAFDTLKLNDQWLLNGGLRLDKYKVVNKDIAANGAVTEITDSDSIVSWKLGAVYKPAANGSIYGSFSTSQQPPGGSNFSLNATATNINNPNLDPQKATNLEFGTKWDLLDNRLAVTGAIYRSENKNEIAATGTLPGEVIQLGKKTVNGIELGLVGEITKAWSVSAGIAKMNTKLAQSNTAAQGATLQWSPDLSFTSWTTYRLGHGITLGGGARYMSSVARQTTNTPAANMPEMPSYWVFDAMASYEVSKNVSLQLNVYNLADKFYLATINNNGNRYTPGAPRSALVTANFKF
jgi:catecholate siderophore receptor